MKEDPKHIHISEYNYPLPDERIAKFPLAVRDQSKLLVYRHGEVSEDVFTSLPDYLPKGSLMVFNNTKVIRARIIMHKPSGARIEVFCLEPYDPADYERAFAVKGSCRWSCIVGNLKKWKDGPLVIDFEYEGRAERMLAWREGEGGREQIVRFEWTADLTFGQLLEHLGRIPIPPYLNRESQEIDNTRYQTVYSKFEGSVAAPTAGLHFTPELIERMRTQGFSFEEVTLHVGAGTFLPVKDRDAAAHPMHTEHFEIRRSSVERLLEKWDNITAVGTTSVRTLESLTALAWRIRTSGTPDANPLASHASVNLADFEKADFITLQQGVALRNITDFYCRAAGFTPHVILESDNPGTVREFIKAGLGVSFAPRITWYGVGGDHVALVPITTPGCQRYISLSWDKNTPLTPPAEELKNYFIKNFKRFAEQYAGVNSPI